MGKLVEGFIKINVDGVVKRDGQSGTSCILRDHKGLWLWGAAQSWSMHVGSLRTLVSIYEAEFSMGGMPSKSNSGNRTVHTYIIS